jgi:hypothetical protein
MLTYADVCRWTEAKDHWASSTLDFETPRKQTLGFKINTHNPESEDLFISRAVHAYQSLRQHMPAYARIRLHTSAYVSICEHTSYYLFISRAAHARRIWDKLCLHVCVCVCVCVCVYYT